MKNKPICTIIFISAAVPVLLLVSACGNGGGNGTDGDTTIDIPFYDILDTLPTDGSDVPVDYTVDTPVDVPPDMPAGCYPPCTEGSCCSGICVDLGSDTANCGTCGNICPGGQVCIAGVCRACTPDCTGKMCGNDGCGGTCGACGAEEACVDGQCEPCMGSCEGRDCGDDGCGHSCGTCPPGQVCSDGTCVSCTPDCTGRNCGDDDGCGGKCDGPCPGGGTCDGGVCVGACVPDCTGKECGNDGCGGSCGDCEYGNCQSGTCVCVTKCITEGWLCGWDGCGGSCGECGEDEICNALHICVGNPEVYGCSDGTREGFTNVITFADIASCAGAWDDQSLRGTPTGVACGNSLPGQCNTPGDLCASGWHICMKQGWPGDLADRISAADCHSGTSGEGIFVAASNNAVSCNPCVYEPLPFDCTAYDPCYYGDLVSVACGTESTVAISDACLDGIWTANTPGSRRTSCNNVEGGPGEDVNGVLCCKDPPIIGH